MSFILEALKKAETERRQGLPGKPDPAAPEPRPPQSRRGWPVLLLILVLLVNAGLLAWWLKPWAKHPVPPQGPGVVGKTATAPAPAPEPAAAIVTWEAAPAPAADQGTVDTGEPPVDGQSPAIVQEPVAAAEPIVNQEPAATPPAGAEAETPPSQPVPAGSGSAAVQNSTSAPATTVKATLPAAQQVPAYRDLPPAERGRIPEIDVQLHYYTAARERRLVRINGTNLHEGEGAGGVRVDEIRPDGMVLEAGGVTFLYPASRR